MITENRYPNETRTLYGISADTKPTESYNGLPIANGSAYVEIDTGYVYLYNAAGTAWVKI